MDNLSPLEQLIDADFGFVSNGGSWGRSRTHSSLVIDRTKQLFYWNSEGIQGTLYDYLTKVRNYSYDQAKSYLKETGQTDTFIHEVRNKEEIVVYPKLVETFHEALQYQDKSYWTKRTITEETQNRFQLGYYNGYYTIPIFVGGVFKNFQLRKENPKEIRSYYRGVGPLLFGEELLKFTNKIYITESPVSAIILNQNSIPAVSFTAGSEGFQKSWFSKFDNQREIYLLWDNDKAGRYGVINTAAILGEFRCHAYTFDGFDEKFGADNWFICEGNGEEFLELVEKNKKYVFQMEEYKDKEYNKYKRK